MTSPGKRTALVLFRHGQTDWNLKGLWQGQKDIELNRTGWQQARAFAERYRYAGITLVASSDLLRAKQTAGVLAAKISCDLIFHQGLRETNFGLAEGLTKEQVTQRFGLTMFREWKSHTPASLHCRFPEGESRSEVLQRATSAMQVIVEQNPQHKKIAISTHGGLLRQFLLSLGHRGVVDEGPLPHCFAYHCQFDHDLLRFVVVNQ